MLTANHPTESPVPRPNLTPSNTVLGDVLALLGAFMYGVYTTAMRRLLPDGTHISLSLFFGLIGFMNGICLLPCVFIFHWTHVETLSGLTCDILGLLSLQGLIDNVISDYLWALAMFYTTPTVATIGLSLTVPLAIVSDVVLHQMSPTLIGTVAATLVILGFVLINLSSHENKKKNVLAPYEEDGSDEANVIPRNAITAHHGMSDDHERCSFPDSDHDERDENNDRMHATTAYTRSECLLDTSKTIL